MYNFFDCFLIAEVKEIKSIGVIIRRKGFSLTNNVELMGQMSQMFLVCQLVRNRLQEMVVCCVGLFFRL